MTTTFNLTKTNIIKRALQLINVIDLDATPDSNQYNYASDVLNLMIKKWEAQGINLWKRRLGYLFTAKDTSSYSLGTSGTNATLSYVSTTISTTEALGQTTLSVTSSSGMTANDYVGIELDDGTRQWSTISSVPNSTSIIIADALTDSATAANTVIAYTTKISRPLRIIRGTTLDLANSNQEAPIRGIGHDEYFDLPIKTSGGRANQFYYDKLLSGSTPYTGTLYLYPRPDDVNVIITFSFQEPLSDITNTTDYADFPQEWGFCLVFNLACELAYQYGKFEELKFIQPKASQELMDVQQFDSDDTPLKFTRDDY